MSTEMILKCRGLVKTYKSGEKPAVDGLDLEVRKNSVFGYLGPNGAGKTTTIKIMTGLIRSDEGTVWVGDKEVNRHSLELRSRIGYLSQDPKYYSWMTGRELLEFVGSVFGMSAAERRKRADELLELAGLADTGKKRISGYSGGMVQRIGIAQALVNRPEVLFLDEPVSALDPIGRKEVLEFIDGLRDITTVFMSTHILSDVERVCDTVGIINKGKIIALEETSALKQSFAPPKVELTFDTRNDAESFAALAAQRGWKLESGEAGQDRILRLTPADFSASRQDILKVIADNGLSLNAMETKSATLEDVFVKMIQEEGVKI
jgi:ABC-2 type transport system ATP-binding protein